MDGTYTARGTASSNGKQTHGISHIFERHLLDWERALQNRGTPQVCLNLYIYYYCCADRVCVMCATPRLVLVGLLALQRSSGERIQRPIEALSLLPLGAHTDLLPALAKIQGPRFFICALFLTHPPHGQIILRHDHRKLTLPDLSFAPLASACLAAPPPSPPRQHKQRKLWTPPPVATSTTTRVPRTTRGSATCWTGPAQDERDAGREPLQ